MPFVEIVSFPANDALVADPLLAQRALTTACKAEGFIHAYTGQQVEDNRVFYLALEWTSKETHDAFESSSAFTKGLESVATIAAGPPSVHHHVTFNRTPSAAFDAPVTEFALIKLREGKTKEEFVSAHEEALSAAGVNIPTALGDVTEIPGLFYAVAGWDSVEQHKSALKNGSAQVGSLLEPGASVVHIKFTKF